MDAVSFSVLTETPPDGDRSYGAYYAAIDPLLQLAMAHSPGAWLRCREPLDENFVRRNEFYPDYLAPYGLRYLLGGSSSNPMTARPWLRCSGGPGQGLSATRMWPAYDAWRGISSAPSGSTLAASDLRAHAQMGASALDSLSYALWIVRPTAR